MDGEMSLLDRLRPDRPSTTSRDRALPPARSRTGTATGGTSARGGIAGRLDLAREHAVRSHEPQGWLGGVLIGAWAALLSLLAVALPVLLVWATSQTSTTWGQAVRVASQTWLLVHGVALQVPGGRLHLLPLALTALPLLLCWRAGRRVGRSAPSLDPMTPGVALRSLGAPVAGLAVGYAVVLVGAALLAHGSDVRPVWWQAVIAGLAIPLLGGGPAALRAAWLARRGSSSRPVTSVVADWCRVPPRLRRAVQPAAALVGVLVSIGALLVVVSVAVQHERVLAVQHALAPGAVGTVVLALGQLALLPNLALWAVAWCAGPGFAVGVGTAVTPAASTLGLLPLVPVLGALPSPGPLPAVAQAVPLVPVLLGAAVGWWCARRAAETEASSTGSVASVVLDAVIAAALAAVLLSVLLLLSAGSAGPDRLADVGPSAWLAGLALLGELTAGAAVTAWITGRRA